MEINFNIKRIKIESQRFKVSDSPRNQSVFKPKKNQEIQITKKEAVQVSGRVVKKAQRKLTIGSYNKQAISRSAFNSLFEEGQNSRMLEAVKNLEVGFDAGALLREVGNTFDTVMIGSMSK